MDMAACNFDAGNDGVDCDNDECVYADETCEECAEDGTVMLNDADGDGVCDEDEIEGCFDETACNYNPEATNDDGSCVDVEPGSCDCLGNVLDDCGVCGGDGSSCDPCAAASQAEAYPLTVEAAPAAGVDGTVYRFYVNAQDASDKISAVFGSDAGRSGWTPQRAFSTAASIPVGTRRG